MQPLRHQARLIFEDLGNGFSLCRAMGYGGYSRIFSTDVKSSNAFDRNITEMTEQVRLDQYHRLVFPDQIEVCSTVVELGGQSNDPNWPHAFPMTINFLTWQHDELTKVAFVPALNIKISCKITESIDVKVNDQSAAILSQFQFGPNLCEFLYLSENVALKTTTKPLDVILKTLKEREQENDTQRNETETLDKVATNLNKQSLPQAFMVDKLVRGLGKVLRDPERNSVLLTGASGVGKTSVFYELVRERKLHQFVDTQFWETSGSKLIAGMSGFGQWQDRCEKLVEELSRQSAVLFVGNLFELSEVGRGGGNRQGIAAYLRTYIQRGRIQVVAECTAEQYSLIEQSDPQILDCLSRFEIDVPDQKKTESILKEVADHHSTLTGTQVDQKAIKTIDSLHRRYARYASQPQRSIQFLTNLIDAAQVDEQIDVEAVITRFSAETGLPHFMITDSEALDLQKTTDWFSARIIQQPEPVELVVDLLAAVKSGLTPPDKPIASLMLIGPTGVGKTEMAKSLAHFMYGDPNKMLRFDMSEYNHPASIQRLIGGLGYGQGILTSRVRQNPFHVVLFDEIEKADHSFFDLLLQILGEGRLTDGRGQVADFTSSIVLMTSNLGVDSFKTGSLGFKTEANTGGYREHFVNEVRRFVRPELFNRIDRIVPFAPLSREAVNSIAKREIEQIKLRDGIRYRDINFDITPESITFVAQQGFDAQLGARPLKRYIEKQLVAPMARKLNDTTSDATNITIEVRNNRLQCQVKPKPTKTSGQKHGSIDIQSALEKLSDQRRRIQALEMSTTSIELKNEKYRLEHQMERWIKKMRKASSEEEIKSCDLELRMLELRLSPITSVLDNFEKQKKDVLRKEQEWILKFFEQQPIDPGEVAAIAYSAQRSIDELIMQIMLSRHENTQNVTLVLFSRFATQIKKLAMAYDTVAQERAFDRKYFQLCRANSTSKTANFRVLEVEQENDSTRRSVDAFRVGAIEELFENQPGPMIGVALEFGGVGAFPILSLERGNHIFRIPNKDREIVLVEASGTSLLDYSIPRNILDRMGPFDWATTRRTYDEDNRVIFDPILNKQLDIDGSIGTSVVNLVEATFRVHLEKMLDLWK